MTFYKLCPLCVRLSLTHRGTPMQGECRLCVGTGRILVGSNDFLDEIAAVVHAEEVRLEILARDHEQALIMDAVHDRRRGRARQLRKQFSTQRG